MASMKILFLVLATMSSCHGNPGYRRGFNPDGSAITAAELHQPEEIIIAEAKVSETPLDAAVQEDTAQLEPDYTIRELLRNKIIGRPSHQRDNVESNEDEPQQLIQLSTPAKSQVNLDKAILKSDSPSKRPFTKLGSSADPYEKILESFIRGIMSRVLQAEIKDGG